MRMIYADELEDALTKAGIPIIVKGKATSAWGVPVVDAVPVVRCKDCRWRTGLEEHTAWHPCDEMAVNDNWFCADGEKKDDVSDTNVGKMEVKE